LKWIVLSITVGSGSSPPMAGLSQDENKLGGKKTNFSDCYWEYLDERHGSGNRTVKFKHDTLRIKKREHFLISCDGLVRGGIVHALQLIFENADQ
jgi:hypothetical protein